MEKLTKIQKESQNKPVEPVFSTKIGTFSVGIFLHEYNGRIIPGIKLQKFFTKDGESWKNIRIVPLCTIEYIANLCSIRIKWLLI